MSYYWCIRCKGSIISNFVDMNMFWSIWFFRIDDCCKYIDCLNVVFKVIFFWEGVIFVCF